MSPAPASKRQRRIRSPRGDRSEPTQRPLDPRLLRYATASRGSFIAVAAIALAQTAVVVAFAWLLTRAIIEAIDGGQVTAAIAALAAVIAVRAALIWLREFVAARAAARVQSQLRARVLDAITRLGSAWLSTHHSAGLATVVGRGLESLDAYVGRYLPQLVQTVIATPLLVAVIWWCDPISGIAITLTIPLIPVFMALIGWATRTVQRRQWQTLARLATRFSETVEGLSTLKVFGRAHRAVDAIARITGDYRRETMRVLRVSFLSGFALEFLASISVAIVAVSIGFRLIDGTLPLGVGLFVLLLAPEAYLPIRQVGVQFHAAAEGVAATEDVFAILDADAAHPGDGDGPDPSAEIAPIAPGTVPATGAVRSATGAVRSAAGAVRRAGAVLQVDQGAAIRGTRALPSISFVARPGTLTLLAGPSGAGKSSLFAALRRAAQFEGRIEVDGADVRTLAPASWLAWAGQHPGLLTGTVAQNVALGDPSPDAAIIERALALACAADIPPDLALGVRGAGLSGGQAQRVAVARAIYRLLRGTARLLALDEPSAALDAHTEAALWRNLRLLADDGATIVLVSHRVSARDIADRVVTVTAEVPA